MPRQLREKSTVEEIRQRFDADVERFSKLETGQQAAMDAPLILELVARSAARHVRPGGTLLDLGCGAGNFTLRVLSQVSPLDCVLVDLSRPMLERAEQRLKSAAAGSVKTLQSDIRSLSFGPGSFDLILAGQVLHHLREDAEWKLMFERFHHWLRPGGGLSVADFIAFDDPAIQELMTEHYGEDLVNLGGAEFRDKVLACCEIEDSPRSTKYQLRLLEEVGFSEFDVLHKNALFAAFYARKSRG